MDITKRILSFAAAAVMCALLAGCDEYDPGSAEIGGETSFDTAASQTGDSFSALRQFTASTSNGAQFTQSGFAGADVTMINIWATTCPPCIKEMPELAKIRDSLPDNVRLITWCMDGFLYPDDAKKILKDSGFSGVTIMSGDGDLNTLAAEIMYTPTTVFVDAEGNMVGEPIIGAPRDPEGVYKGEINNILKSMGKQEIE